MARQCRQYGLGTGRCDYWNEDDPSDNTNLPSGCDPTDGTCNPTEDWTEDCDDFFSTEEEECEGCGFPESECECND